MLNKLYICLLNIHFTSMNFTDNVQISTITDNNIKKKSDIYYIVNDFDFSNITTKDIYANMKCNQTEITNLKNFLQKITEELNLSQNTNDTNDFIKNVQKVFSHLFDIEFKFKINFTDFSLLKEISINTINNAESCIEKYKKVFSDTTNKYYNNNFHFKCHFDSTLHKLKKIKLHKKIDQIIQSIPKINSENKNNLSLFIISNLENINIYAKRQEDNFLDFNLLIREGSITTFTELKKIIKNIHILNKYIKNNNIDDNFKTIIEIINKNVKNIFERNYRSGINDSIVKINLIGAQQRKRQYQKKYKKYTNINNNNNNNNNNNEEEELFLINNSNAKNQVNYNNSFNTFNIQNLQIFYSDKF